MHTHRLVYEAAGTVRSLPLRHGARGGVARTWNDHSRAPAVKERENEMLHFKDFEDSLVGVQISALNISIALNPMPNEHDCNR